MATKKEIVQFILETLHNQNVFTAKAMFGEYALYANSVVVGLICNDQLYVKDVPASAVLSEQCEKDSPYDGAKPHWVIEEHQLTKIPQLHSILIDVSDTIRKEKDKKRRRKIK